MADIPQATFSEKNGENFIYVDDKFENEVENYLKKKCIRFIPMTEKQIEFEGYNVTISEDSSFSILILTPELVKQCMKKKIGRSKTH